MHISLLPCMLYILPITYSLIDNPINMW
jgi:hypothetical protein